MGLTSGVKAVSVGVFFACAILADGSVDCWGNNDSAQLGNGTVKGTLVPLPVTGLTGATSISTGWYASCAVASGAVMCWGDNDTGQLGDSSMTASYVPVQVSGLTTGATQVSMGQESACAVVSGGAQCWGGLALGYGLGEPVDAPVQVTGMTSGVTMVAVGTGTACGIANGVAQCWGYNTAGELGDGAATNDLSAKAVAGFP
jgi:trimeric autotransporter adhesin